jgi:TetR/AcrR family transcriptional regulator
MSTKSRKEREKENRREDILKAAENIMLAKGLHGLSIDLVAQETELAKGTIYLYFKSKEEILGVLSFKARVLLFKEFQKIEKSKDSNIEKLRAIARCNFAFYKKNPLHYDLLSLYEANHNLTETDDLYSSSADISELVCGIATKAQAEGTLNSKINPLHFTMCLWGMTVGVLQLLKVRGNILNEKMNIVEEDILNTYMELLENGMKK